MRTTVTLDADTERIIRRRMAAEGVSFKQALNESIRDSERDARPSQAFATRAVPLGQPLVDLTKATRLAAQLDDETAMAKLRREA